MSADWMAGFEEAIGCLGCALLIGGGLAGAIIAALIVYLAMR